jgi:hypothetical protein
LIGFSAGIVTSVGRTAIWAGNNVLTLVQALIENATDKRNVAENMALNLARLTIDVMVVALYFCGNPV